MGDALASNIRAAVNGAYGFFTTFDFSKFGKAIGDTVNGWFNGIDWKKTAQTLSAAVKGVLDTAINFLTTVDWEQIGEDIYTFIANIDWNGICDRVFQLIGAALGGLILLVKGFLKEKIEQGKDFFMQQFEKYDTGSIGLNIVLGLLDGILQGLIGIGEWITDHIFKPIWDGIKEAFGIHSPSKKMGEIGGFLIEGLFNAISDGISRIKEIFEKMLEKIHEVFENIGDWFKARFEDIKNAFSDAPAWFSDKFSDAWRRIKNVFKNLKTWFKNRWQDIKDVFSGIGKWFKNTFSDAWKKIKGVFSGAGEFFGGIWDAIKSKFSDIGTKVGDAIGSAFKTAINSVLETVENAINFVPDAINGAIDLINELPGVEIGYLPYVSLPRLAKGGLATAPTLAMVGDNKNAKTDPEVIAPLSKLEGMMDGGNAEIIELLRIIVELLQNGMNIELINYLFKGSREFGREVLKVIADDKARRGI